MRLCGASGEFDALAASDAGRSESDCADLGAFGLCVAAVDL